MDKINEIYNKLLGNKKFQSLMKAWDCYDYIMKHFSVTDEEAKCLVRKCGKEIY